MMLLELSHSQALWAVLSSSVCTSLLTVAQVAMVLRVDKVVQVGQQGDQPVEANNCCKCGKPIEPAYLPGSYCEDCFASVQPTSRSHSSNQYSNDRYGLNYAMPFGRPNANVDLSNEHRRNYG